MTDGAAAGMDGTTAEQAPAFAVVIVSYRTGPVLLDCVRAALAEPEATEIVVVDNGNEPPALDALRALPGAEGRLTIHTGHGNVGFARGCNLGARASRSPYLLLLNPDCVLAPGTLAGTLALLRDGGPGDLLGVRVLNPDGSEQRGCRRNLLTPATCLVEIAGLWRLGLKRVNLNGEPVPTGPVEVECISGAFMAMRRTFWDRLGGMDEDYFLHVEDVDFCLRARAAGGRIRFAPHLAVTHLQGTSEAPSRQVERWKTESAALYFDKHFRGRTPAPLLWLLKAALHARYWLLRALGRFAD